MRKSRSIRDADIRPREGLPPLSLKPAGRSTSLLKSLSVRLCRLHSRKYVEPARTEEVVAATGIWIGSDLRRGAGDQPYDLAAVKPRIGRQHERAGARDDRRGR